MEIENEIDVFDDARVANSFIKDNAKLSAWNQNIINKQ